VSTKAGELHPRRRRPGGRVGTDHANPDTLKHADGNPDAGPAELIVQAQQEVDDDTYGEAVAIGGSVLIHSDPAATSR
jgi:hypothetical protein